MIVQNMAALCPYRIGDYLQTENPTHPSNSWPGTSWEQLQGRMLMGASGTYPVSSEGGEAQHTLTEAEMPSHQHRLHGWSYSFQDGQSTQFAPTRPYTQYDNTDIMTYPTGGGQAHNNLPPYRAVYIWRRTA